MIRSINNNTPMKIGIQTWGSALADGLQKAGHTVTLAVTSLANGSYAEECKKKGTDYFIYFQEK